MLRKLASAGGNYALISAEEAPEQVAQAAWREVMIWVAAQKERTLGDAAMNESTPMFWTELFGAGGKADLTLNARVIKKSGEPFLILPDAPGMAAEALALYPAQTKFAKLARGALGMILKLRLPFGSEGRATVQLSRDDAFARFLNGLVASKPGTFPAAGGAGGECAHDRGAGLSFYYLMSKGHPTFRGEGGG